MKAVKQANDKGKEKKMLKILFLIMQCHCSHPLQNFLLFRNIPLFLYAVGRFLKNCMACEITVLIDKSVPMRSRLYQNFGVNTHVLFFCFALFFFLFCLLKNFNVAKFRQTLILLKKMRIQCFWFPIEYQKLKCYGNSKLDDVQILRCDVMTQ